MNCGKLYVYDEMAANVAHFLLFLRYKLTNSLFDVHVSHFKLHSTWQQVSPFENELSPLIN